MKRAFSRTSVNLKACFTIYFSVLLIWSSNFCTKPLIAADFGVEIAICMFSHMIGHDRFFPTLQRPNANLLRLDVPHPHTQWLRILILLILVPGVTHMKYPDWPDIRVDRVYGVLPILLYFE